MRDIQGRARIAIRLQRLVEGHFGDHKPLGGGISELRFSFGPGYRIYLTQHGNTIVVLLCAGDKNSQGRDIAKARILAEEIADGA